MSEMLLSSSPHLASLLLLLPSSSFLFAGGSNGGGDVGLVHDPGVLRAGDIAGVLRALVRDDPR